MSTELEQWRHFRRGFKGYHVSNFGRVMGPRGIMAGEIDAEGYHRVTIHQNRKSKRIMVHRLVAMAFIPNPTHRPFVNHKDANKLNNRPENLEWVTQKENIAHSWAMGLQRPNKGMNHYGATLTDELVLMIREIPRGTYGAISGFARRHGVSTGAIQGVLMGKTWKHVTGRAA